MAFLGSANTSTAIAVLPAHTCINGSSFTPIYAAATAVNVLVSLTSNAWVIWLLLKAREGFFPSDLFAFNLAVTELIICPIVVVLLLYFYQLFVFWVELLYFSNSLARAGRPIFQCCICLERYLAVVHPIAFLKYKAVKYKLACLCITWLVTMGFGAIRAWNHSNVSLICVFSVVLAIDTFCSISILQALRKPRPGDREKEEINLMKRRAFNTVLLLQVFMIVNYLPSVLTEPLIGVVPEQYHSCYIHPISSFFLLAGGWAHALQHLSRAGKLSCPKQFSCG